MNINVSYTVTTEYSWNLDATELSDLIRELQRGGHICTALPVADMSMKDPDERNEQYVTDMHDWFTENSTLLSAVTTKGLSAIDDDYTTVDAVEIDN